MLTLFCLIVLGGLPGNVLSSAVYAWAFPLSIFIQLALVGYLLVKKIKD